MAFPEYVTTRPVSVGGAIGLESSELLTVTITVSASRSLIYDATGYRLEQVGVRDAGGDGSEAVVTLPVTDMEGWRDAKTGMLIDVSAEGAYTHRYTAVVDVLQGGRTVRRYTIGPFVLPTGDGVIDLDQLVPSSTVAGDLVMLPAVTQVNGQSGSVVLNAGDVGARPVDWVPTAEDLEPVLEDTFVRRLSVGSRFAVIGDSMEAGDTSWVYYLCALSGGRASLAVKAGVSGNTTTQMLARLQADVIDRNPDVCIVGGATNDHMTGVPQATTLANVQAMVAMLRDAGITAGVRLTPPTNAAGAGPWNTIQLRRDQIRRWNLLLSSWATSEGVFVLDFYTPLVDPATGGFKSGLNSDADHPNEQGFHDAAAFMIAQGLPAAFAFNPAMLSTTLSDPNSLWEPTFGSNGVFVDDTNGDQLANGWNGGGGGTGTRTLVAADPPAVGNWQGYTNPSADWTAYQDSITPPYAAGDVLALSGRFRTTGGGRFRARLTPNNGNASLDFGPLGLPIDDGYFYVELKTTGTGATRARSNLQALIATGTVEFAQVQFVNLTALGII